MSAPNWPAALAIELKIEGGLSDRPVADDPGGRTMHGVTQSVFNSYLRLKGQQVRDVETITDAEVSGVYKELYADKVRFDDLPQGIDLFVLDGAINSGPAQAAKWLQRALGMDKVDGVVGPATVDAAQTYPDPHGLIIEMADRRMAFLRALRNWSANRNGWTHRNEYIEGAAGAMVEGQAFNQEPVGATTTKALLENAKAPPSMAPAAAVSSTGTIGVVLSQATTALQPLTDHFASIGTGVLILTAVSGLLAAGGFAYGAWAKSRQRSLADALDITPPSAPLAAN